MTGSPTSRGQLVLGGAFYLRGELHRLRGELADAEHTYRLANESGHDPQPGLALLRLAQGRVDDADTAVRRVLFEAEDPMTRARVLGPYAEIMVAAGDVEAARTAADELAAIAGELGQPFLDALSSQVNGAVLLAENNSRRRARVAAPGLDRMASAGSAARSCTRRACSIALACRALGDDDSAEMELDAARSIFAELRAMPDVARTESLSASQPQESPAASRPARWRCSPW